MARLHPEIKCKQPPRYRRVPPALHRLRSHPIYGGVAAIYEGGVAIYGGAAAVYGGGAAIHGGCAAIYGGGAAI
eukprot:3486957-Rhodomonas_salina.1